jgi:hypothetical protein
MLIRREGSSLFVPKNRRNNYKLGSAKWRI